MHWATTGYDNQDVLKDRYLTKPRYPVDEIQIGYGYGWLLSAYRGIVCSLCKLKSLFYEPFIKQ